VGQDEDAATIRHADTMHHCYHCHSSPTRTKAPTTPLHGHAPRMWWSPQTHDEATLEQLQVLGLQTL
jgi:hypothetical protein